MIRLLSRFLIRDYENTSSPEVRLQYGMLTGGVGIILNLLLFLFKWIAGTLSGSIAIVADAFNNLSDAGTSVITLFGFRMAGQKPDTEHPFGHGRMEYISGLLVSVAILLMGFELLKESVSRILHPEETQLSVLVVCILAVSVLVKLYMFYYNRRLGEKLDSPAMKAASMDSLSDAVSTGVVLAASLIGAATGLHLDGWLGILISLLILWTGIQTIRDTIDPLLGKPPTPEFVREVREIVTSHSMIHGIHDLVVHDYGPGRTMITLHAEVPCDADIRTIHEQIDHIEVELAHKLGCSALIHTDPIITDEPEALALKETVQQLAAEIDPRFRVHDFRLVPKENYSKVIFDLEVPYDYKTSDTDVIRELHSRILALPDKRYYAKIHVDRCDS